MGRDHQGLIKHAKGDGNMAVREVDEPKAGPGRIKVEVKAARIPVQTAYLHDDLAGITFTLGDNNHVIGVRQSWPGVAKWKIDDRVTSETAFSFCGDCLHCRTGRYNLCNNRRTLGYWYNGVFAKYSIVPKERVHRLPDHVDYIAGALCEPLACVTHAVLELTTITSGDVVLVSGPGSIGFLASIAKSQGAVVLVSGTDIDSQRLFMAKKLGAAYAIDVTRENLGEVINRHTGGRGADVVLECSGSPRAANDVLVLTRKGGQYTQIGLFGKPIQIDFEKICFRELKVTGSLGSTWTSWEKAIQLIAAGTVNTRDLVSDIMPITAWEKAFAKFENKEGMKIVLTPVE